MSNNTHTITIKAITAQAKDAIKSVQNSVDDMISTIERNRDGIESLGIMSGVAFAGLTGGIVKAVGEANKLENALMGLESIVVGTGGNFEDAKKKIQEFTADGLVGIDEASLALKNLLARGYGQDEALAVMSRIKDAAAYGRQAGLSLGEAVVTATEGLKNENSILVDNAGITKNVAKMWEDYAKQIGKSTKDLTDAEKRQAEINGIMEETKFQIGDAEKVSKTFSGTLLRVQGGISTLFAEIGATVKPVLNDLLVTIEPIIAKITTWITNNQELAGKILLVATAVTGIITVMAGLALAIGPIISGISLLGTIIGALISPIGLVIGAIVALGVAYKENFLGFQDFVNGIIEWVQKIPEKFSEMKEKVIRFFSEQIEGIRQKIDEGKRILSDFWTEWKNTIQVIAGIIAGLYLPTLAKMSIGLIKLGIQTAVELIKMGVQWTVMGAKATATAVVVGVRAIPSIIASLVQMGMAGVVHTGKIIAAWALMGMQSLIAAGKMAVAWVIALGPIAWISSLIAGLGVLIWQNWDSIKKWTIETWDNISKTISETWENIVKWVSEKIILFSNILSGAWESIKTTVVNVWNSIVGFFVGIWESIKSGVSNFGETIKNIWSNIWNGVSEIGGNILNSITGFIGNTWENIKNGVSNFGENIKNKWSNIWGKIKETGGNLLSNIGNGVKNTFTGVTDWIGGVFGIDLTGAFSNSFEKAKEATIGIVTGMVDRIKGILDNIRGFISKITGGIIGAGEEAQKVQKGVRTNNSGGGGIAGAKASGGSVLAGSRYMVGERGPELFVPSTNGYIVPNNQLGGGATININMGSIIVQNEADENRLAEKISQRLAKEARLYKLGIA